MKFLPPIPSPSALFPPLRGRIATAIEEVNVSASRTFRISRLFLAGFPTSSHRSETPLVFRNRRILHQSGQHCISPFSFLRVFAFNTDFLLAHVSLSPRFFLATTSSFPIRIPPSARLTRGEREQSQVNSLGQAPFCLRRPSEGGGVFTASFIPSAGPSRTSARLSPPHMDAKAARLSPFFATRKQGGFLFMFRHGNPLRRNLSRKYWF